MSRPTRAPHARIAIALSLALSLGVAGLASTDASAKGGKHDRTEQSEKRGGKKADKKTPTAVTPSDATPTTVTSATVAPTTEAPTTVAPTMEPIVVAEADAAMPMSTNYESTARSADFSTFVENYEELLRADGTTLDEVVEQIGADDMWAAGFTGAGVDIAIIDTGVAPVAELSTTDVFVGPDLSFEGGVDAVAGLDTFGHGTHMAGIIAGRTPGADPLAQQANDFVGVAPDARLVSVKVADNTGATDVSQVIAAIDWVVQNRNTNGLNIRVLNLSYNTTGEQSYIDDPLSKAVENAWNHGIVVVVAAGNEGMLSFGLANPATNPNVIAVSTAALHPDYGWLNPLWAPSGDGTRNPDVLAPGVSIESLRNPGSRIDLEHSGGRINDDRLFRGSGTSQSAAVVSGAAALLLQQRPYLTPDSVKQLLSNTATNTFQFETLKGNGVINLQAAMSTKFEPIAQDFEPATGLGLLEASRGDDHVLLNGEPLVGEYTVTGDEWIPELWVTASEAGTAWSGDDAWSGSSWSGSSWSGSSWSGSSWSGSSWSGSSWSGSSWSGSSWSGSSWSGSSWSGSSWSGSSWSGSSWSGSSWSGSSWSGSSWS